MNKKILLGMSGGVDSSVSAIVLKNMGYEVIGATMKLWEEESKCCNLESVLDAKRVCDKLEIPHYTLNFRDEFKEKVVDMFVSEYMNCRTPNPCIECNKYLKFGLMYKRAKELNIEYIATGHYAKVEYSEKYQRYVLKKAKNLSKDQSYVLYNIPKEMLKFIIFPLGDFESKDEVRKVAKNYGLNVASKPDSQDICFIPKGKYKDFILKYVNDKKQGKIIDKNNKVLGKHEGLFNYTIGQRKGLKIATGTPMFVTKIDKNNNTLVIGNKEDLYTNEIYLNNVNLLLIDEIKEKVKVMVKTRYSAKEEPGYVEKVDDMLKVTLDNKIKNVAPGQSVVFYVGDIVLGGGKVINT